MRKTILSLKSSLPKNINRLPILFTTKQYQISSFHTSLFSFSSENTARPVISEHLLKDILQKHFQYEDKENTQVDPNLIIKVNDMSGGCGAMFDILVVSKKFEGLSMVKQHKMVMELLKKEIKSIHGLTLNTKTPSQYIKFTNK
ncbi:hypothetical protein ABK040_013286 [Willaertia magna]